MRIGQRSWSIPRSSRRARQASLAAVLILAIGSGCGSPSAGTSDPAIAASGFPIGAFTKRFEEPTFGPGVLAWRFEADGRWAEIPLDGAPFGAKPIRGRFSVDGDSLTLLTDYPPGLGTSRHTWRVEEGRLWTRFVSSDLPDDAAWFAMLDGTPWVPLE